MINYKNFKENKLNLNKSKGFVIENFLDQKKINILNKEIILLENKSKNFKKFFLKQKSKKTEYLDFNEYYTYQKNLIKSLSTKKFRDYLRKKLKIKENIFPDRSKMYSGFNIVKKNGFLKPHVDFNYNSKLKKFRTINLLIYFNKNWKKSYGGNLTFYKTKKNKNVEILASENRSVFFLTNKFTPHGYKKISTSKKRISLNFYYYTNKNFSFSKNPHKTLWKK